MGKGSNERKKNYIFVALQDKYVISLLIVFLYIALINWVNKFELKYIEVKF